jgi:ribosomal-protein-alanine N-acetyltransferase
MNELTFISPEKNLVEQYKIFSDQMSEEDTFVLMSGEKYNLEETGKIIKNLQDKTNFPFAIWAISDNKIVGQIFLKTYSERTRGEHKVNFGLYVIPEYRGRGLASKLLSQAIKQAKELGFKMILIQVFDQNKPAIRLYEKFGFKTIGIVPKGYYYKDQYVDERFMYLYLEV